jgi:hypothetical protein
VDGGALLRSLLVGLRQTLSILPDELSRYISRQAVVQTIFDVIWRREGLKVEVEVLKPLFIFG